MSKLNKTNKKKFVALVAREVFIFLGKRLFNEWLTKLLDFIQNL